MSDVREGEVLAGKYRVDRVLGFDGSDRAAWLEQRVMQGAPPTKASASSCSARRT